MDKQAELQQWKEIADSDFEPCKRNTGFYQ